MYIPVIIFFGHERFGQVDKVRGKYHVATLFGHIFGLPLIPYGTFLVPKSDPARAIRLSFSWKSFFMAWVRAALIVATVYFGMTSIVSYSGEEIINRPAIAITAASFLLIVMSYFWPGIGIAGKRRRAQLELIASEAAVLSERAFPGHI